GTTLRSPRSVAPISTWLVGPSVETSSHSLMSSVMARASGVGVGAGSGAAGDPADFASEPAWNCNAPGANPEGAASPAHRPSGPTKSSAVNTPAGPQCFCGSSALGLVRRNLAVRLELDCSDAEQAASVSDSAAIAENLPRR